MIIQAKTKEPYIHLGFNKQTITVAPNEDIVLWQDTIYNNDVYVTTLVSLDAVVVSQNLGKIVFTFPNVGTYPITVTALGKDKRNVLTSNTVNIEVFQPSYIFSDKRNSMYIPLI
jgi:sulfur carrier protein ThiS